VALKRRAGALSSSLGPFLILMHPSGLAAKHSEKDRYVRPYAQGHTSEELETYLLDLNHQIDNLRLLIESAQAALSRSAENELAAKNTEAWLLTVHNRIAEVEEDTDEAFKKRRELAKLLVERIDVGRDENGRPRARITYRFGPPRPPPGLRTPGPKRIRLLLVNRTPRRRSRRNLPEAPRPPRPTRSCLPRSQTPLRSFFDAPFIRLTPHEVCHPLVTRSSRTLQLENLQEAFPVRAPRSSPVGGAGEEWSATPLNEINATYARGVLNTCPGWAVSRKGVGAGAWARSVRRRSFSPGGLVVRGGRM